MGAAEGVKDVDEIEEKYTTLLPENYKELGKKEIAWWIANYFVPFDEIESYSLSSVACSATSAFIFRLCVRFE